MSSPATEPDPSLDQTTQVLSRSGLENVVAALSTHAAVSLVYVRVEEHPQVIERPFDLDIEPAGNVLLRAVANRLHQLARETDLVCRWNDRDFVIIGPGERAAPALARRIHASLREPSRTVEPFPPMDVSIGWTTAPDRWRLVDLVADASERLGPVQLRLRSRLAQLSQTNGGH